MGKRLPFLIAVTLLACSGPSVRPAEREIGERLPPAAIATLAGEAADLAAVVRGRVAFVTLWATWCEACLKEIDGLNRLNARLAARGVGGEGIVVAVAVGEPLALVKAFAEKRGILYAQMVDEEFHLADALGQRRVPTSLVIDRAGRIVYRGDALDSAGLAAFRRALGDAPAAD